MYISLWENSRGHPDNISFLQFSTKIDGFEQKDSQGFENSYKSYEQYPLEKFFIFTIYQNYDFGFNTFNFALKLWDVHMDHNFKLCLQYQNFEVRWKVKLINVWTSAPKKGSSHFVWYFHSNWKLTEKV